MDQRELRPDFPRMTDAELRIARNSLGVTGEWLAGRLNVSARTVRNWEEGKHQIPPGVADELTALIAEQQAAAEKLAEQIENIDLPTIYTYRDDRDYKDAHPNGGHCAGWHRAMVGRVAERNPRVVIVYYSKLPHIDAELAEQLRDVMNGVFIDAVARSDAKAFLVGEIEDCLDDATGKTAYPELLEAARDWSTSEAEAVLTNIAARNTQ